MTDKQLLYQMECLTMTDEQLLSEICACREDCLRRASNYTILARSFCASGVMSTAADYETFSHYFSAAAERLQYALEFLTMAEAFHDAL